MKNPFKKKLALPSLSSDRTKTIASSLVSIGMGIVFGCLLLFLIACFDQFISDYQDIPVGQSFKGMLVIILGVFSSAIGGGISTAYLIGDMLFRATPLIMTGLSAALAYKTGLFNIGAPGQYLMGTVTSISVALTLGMNGVNGFISWIVAFLAAIIAGALWGCIPGLFKAFFNVNEVITSIMTNWIAANFVTWFFSTMKQFQNTLTVNKTGYTITTGTYGVATPKLFLNFDGSYANGGILIAILLAVGVYVLLNKTTFGFELKACGSNKNAAKYAGMSAKRNIVLSMALAGGLSAVGAALYYLQGDIEYSWTNAYMSLPQVGFNGIPVALLANCNPIGTIFAALFMAYLNISGSQLRILTFYDSEYISNIIIAVIVYLSAFSVFFKSVINGEHKLFSFAKSKDGENDGAKNFIKRFADKISSLKKNKNTVAADKQSDSAEKECVKEDNNG